LLHGIESTPSTEMDEESSWNTNRRLALLGFDRAWSLPIEDVQKMSEFRST
jgi:hypothetical protein